MRFCGRVVPSGITLSFAFSGNLSAMDITLLENQCVKLRGCGGWPPAMKLNLIRYIFPQIRSFKLQPICVFQQPSTNGLSKALYFKEGIPVIGAALSANDDGVSGCLHVVKEFLHQKLVIDIIVGKLVNAEETKSAIIL